jgi:hypothetical protein
VLRDCTPIRYPQSAIGTPTIPVGSNGRRGSGGPLTEPDASLVTGERAAERADAFLAGVDHSGSQAKDRRRVASAEAPDGSRERN